jgi:CubicO group peptidase (beta-lactamase class C family)
MAATESGVAYEGVFGSRCIHDGPAMTRDTIFRAASMVKLITTVAALRLVEQGKLSLEAPVPDIVPVIAAPQVLDGFDPAGKPLLRPAKRPISLHDLLTQTACAAILFRWWHLFERAGLSHADPHADARRRAQWRAHPAPRHGGADGTKSDWPD